MNAINATATSPDSAHPEPTQDGSVSVSKASSFPAVLPETQGINGDHTWAGRISNLPFRIVFTMVASTAA